MALILVVDDDPVIHKLLDIALGQHYNIIHAYTADSAWDIINLRKPSLVILDVVMPGNLNGIQLLCKLKNSDELSKIQVVMMSGSGEAFIPLSKSVKYGATDYLTKPFSVTHMSKIVNTALQKECS